MLEAADNVVISQASPNDLYTLRGLPVPAIKQATKGVG
jgi:hypothetical protein